LPAGVLLLAFAIVWTLIGVVVLRAQTSTFGVLGALLTFVGPASLIVLIGPALILVVQNLE
jgi:hypothetical protein